MLFRCYTKRELIISGLKYIFFRIDKELFLIIEGLGSC